MKRTEETLETVRSVKHECNSIKSQLIYQQARLVNDGAIREAKGLEAVIIKLEQWQAK